MPNIETVRALVSAFNIHNYARNTVETNFTLQSDCNIAVLFDKGMDKYHCSRYLDSIKRKIIREFYGIEESNDAEILDTAKLIFDVKSFPFDISRGKLSMDESGRFKFVTPIDKGVIFNLKSHLAFSLKKDVQEDMSIYITAKTFHKEKYLWCGKFDNKELRKQFEREFLSRMKSRYGYRNVFKNPLKVEGDSVYIKDVFDDARFIDSVTRYIAWLEGMGLQDDSKNYSEAKAFKDLIIEFIDQSTGLTVAGFIRNFPLNEKTAKILIPVVLDNGGPRMLGSEEALKLSYAFNYAVFNNLYSKVQAELPIDGDSGIYGINLSDPEISHCVITKIIKSSVINKDHELSIDPELRFRALSPSFPTPPPTPVLNGPSSGLTEPSPTQQFLTRSQGEELKESARQGFIELSDGLLSSRQVDVPGTSREFLPSTWMSSTAVSQHAQPEKCVNAAQNVQVGPSAWSSSAPSAGFSSWKGAAQNVQAGTSAWAQPIGAWSSSAPSAGFSSWDKSGSASTSAWSSSAPSAGFSSWKGNVQASTNLWTQQPNPWSPQSTSGRLPTPSGDSSYPQQRFSGPIRFSSRGSRPLPYVRSPSVHSEDSGLGSSRPASTSSTVYSADSGFESRPPSTFTDTSNYENQKELTEKELIINKLLKNVKEIAAKNIEGKQTLTKEKIHEYIEGFAKLEKADQTYQYCISFDEGYFKGKESSPTSIFDIFKDNDITVLDSALNSCGLKNSDSYEYKNDKLYIKGIIDINAIKKIAENARMPDRESLPEWIQKRAKAVANKRNKLMNKNVLTPSEEELTKALLHMVNFYNYSLGKAHTNFTLEDGKIVSLLDVDTTEYLKKVRSDIIENHCNAENVSKRIYNLEQFPFVFPSDFQRDKGGKIIIAHNVYGAIPNLKVHLIQDFRIQVEEEVAKKLEEMGVTEARERIKESAYLAAKSKNPDVWYVFFDSKCFQEEPGLFENFKSTYVEVFKSRWKECGLDDSLVSHENGVLYIKNAIDINVVKKIEEYKRKKYEGMQASSPSGETPVACIPDKEAMGRNSIVYEKGQYLLDHDFGSDEDMDCGEPSPRLDRENTRRKSQKRKSPSPSSEDEGSPTRKSQRSESGNSSSEEQPDSPHQGLTDPTLEQVREQFGKASI